MGSMCSDLLGIFSKEERSNNPAPQSSRSNLSGMPDSKTSNRIGSDYKPYYASSSPYQSSVESSYNYRTYSYGSSAYYNPNSTSYNSSNQVKSSIYSKPSAIIEKSAVNITKPTVNSKTGSNGSNIIVQDYKACYYGALSPDHSYDEDTYNYANRISKQNKINEKNVKDKKKFGYYKCGKCKRQWQSAHSWDGFGQDCQNCGNNVKPYLREDLIKSSENKIDQTKPHQKSMCEKCKEVGDCTQKTYSKRKKRLQRAYH